MKWNNMNDISLRSHPLADVQSDCIGSGTAVWQYVVILKGAKVGRDCNICSHVFIENGVIMGDRVTVKCGVQLWDGVTIEDDVFIGANTTFSNDLTPRSRKKNWKKSLTRIQRGASLGANSTILPVTIGSYAMIAAGAVVTRDVPDHALVMGNPARISGWVCHCGLKLQFNQDDTVKCKKCDFTFRINPEKTEVKPI